MYEEFNSLVRFLVRFQSRNGEPIGKAKKRHSLLTPYNSTNYEALGSSRKSEENALNSVRDAEVAGSSPATPTIVYRDLQA